MKITRLRYLAAIIQCDLSITAAAEKLHTSQPNVSKQLMLLEDELGFPLFEREARALKRVTAAGREVFERALRILEEAQNIRRLSLDARREHQGSLAIGTTHTQARYVLPPIIEAFRNRYPDIDLHLHQGSSEQIAELAKADRIDLAIATGSDELFPGLALLPWYRWNRCVIVPRGHELSEGKPISLAVLAKYPIVTYTFSFTGQSSLPAMFEAAGLKLRVALTASDADIIKTYVRLGLGVGIIAGMAIDPKDDDLAVLAVDDLFAAHLTWAGFKRGRLLRGYMHAFLGQLAPHLSLKRIESAIRAPDAASVARLFQDVRIPGFADLDRHNRRTQQAGAAL
jgi:LysR family transcriptional regulator, cys regulon transcriptional activator